jgi:3-hydroxy-3-methylglutaryl CoA synthase
MAGITACGAYIPIYRLSRDDIARVWGGGGGGGEKAVANFDEDSLTMGVEAAIDCLGSSDRSLIDGLYFASTTPPYREKQSASIIAAALDLRANIFTADFTDSLRAGTSAFRAALDAVNSGSARQVLVVVADCRLPAPNTEFEMLFGDGAAAFLVGADDTILDIEGASSLTSEFIDTWRTERDIYPRTWEDRFILDEGYLKILPQTVTSLLKSRGLTAKDFSKAVFYAPDARRHTQAARSLGFDAKTQLQDAMFNTVGNTGAALAPIMLVAALESARSGDRILFATYGDGGDAYIFRVTPRIEKMAGKRGIKRHLESKLKLSGYGKYVHFRSLMTWEAERRPPEYSSLTSYWRDRKEILALIGNKCRQCGQIQIDFPRQHICSWCQAQDNFEPVRLSDKKGVLFTFSMDERARILDLPSIICVVDIDGGGRFFSQMTDREPDKIKVGMSVELTFRNLHDGMGVHNYFWKVRPVRC